VVESWLNSAATEQTRGQILSVYGMTGLLAGIIGQLLLPAANPAGFRAFCVITIIIAIASAGRHRLRCTNEVSWSSRLSRLRPRSSRNIREVLSRQHSIVSCETPPEVSCRRIQHRR
jgi:hypothetical protein